MLVVHGLSFFTLKSVLRRIEYVEEIERSEAGGLGACPHERQKRRRGKRKGLEVENGEGKRGGKKERERERENRNLYSSKNIKNIYLSS